MGKLQTTIISTIVDSYAKIADTTVRMTADDMTDIFGINLGRPSPCSGLIMADDDDDDEWG